MKKILFIVFGTALVAGFLALCFAQEKPVAKSQTEMAQTCPMYGMMMSKGKMMCMCPMHGGMMKSMACPSIIATEDGGVVIMAYNKLTKYDKELNFVKEAEIKIDTESMKKAMTQMMEGCPMCSHMTQMQKPQ